MFDFLRDIGKSKEEKDQEALSAYLDDTLTPTKRARFEQLLAVDETLRASLEEQRAIRAAMSRLPRQRAPRNFTLDPALYGRPLTSAADRLYPVLRTATAIVAILFVFVLVLDFLPLAETTDDAVQDLAYSAETSAEEMAAPLDAAQALVEESAVEVTQVVVEVEEEVEMAVEEPAEETAEEMAEEAPVEESMMAPAQEPSGGGAPAEEAPLAGEGLAAAPEGETAGDGADEKAPQPQATIAAQAAETATNGAGRAAATGPAPLVAEPESEDAAKLLDEQITDEQDTRELVAGELVADDLEEGASEIAVESRLSASQILAISLGLCLVILFIATLLLRLRAL